jgi:hypothetical protein
VSTIPPPEQRETYCHECLAENPRTRSNCVSCGARLRHPKEFAQVMQESTATVNVRTFGNVGALLSAGFYGLGLAVLLPEWLADYWIVFALGGIAMLALGRLAGRFIAQQFNDSTV